MPIVSLFVRFNGRDQKYDLDGDRPFETHMQNICSMFNVTIPDLYGLQISSTYTFLKPEVLINNQSFFAISSIFFPNIFYFCIC